MFEAYEIAVRISVVNHVSSALMAMSQQFSKVHGQAGDLQRRLDAIKLTVLKGGAFLGAGAFGLKMFDGAIKSADEYYHQLALLKNIGMSQVEVAESVKKAWDTTHEVMSTKAADNIKTLLELRSAFGEGKYHEALAILPMVQRLGAVLQSITGAPQDHVGFDMIKAIEISTKGALSEEGVKKQAEMMSKAIIAMNGTITVADFHQALKYSRAAAPYMSDEFKYQYLPTLIQEMKTRHGGASGAGNVIASLFGMVVGRIIPKDLISNWVAAGLVNPKMVVNDPHNRTTSKILPGGVVGSSEFAPNPETYAQKYIKPAIERLQAKYHISELDAYYALTKNRMNAFGLQTFVNKGPQFQRDKGLIDLAPNSSTAYNNLAKTDPQLARAQLAAQWENLKVRLAYDVMPKLIQAFNWMASRVSDLVGFMEKHQSAVTAFVGAFLGLSTLSTVAGSILLVKGAVQALSLALSLTGAGGLGTAVGALMSPIGIAVLALGTLAAAIYAFRPMSQSEIDSYKTDGGVKLSAGSKARIDAGALNTVSPLARHQGNVQTSIHLDGRKIADAMTPYVSAAMSKSSNTSNLDYGLSLPMPGMNN